MVALRENDVSALVCRDAYKDVYRTVSGREGWQTVVELATSPMWTGHYHSIVLGSCVFTTASASAVSCVVQATAPDYDQGFVNSVLAADAAKPDASFNNVVDILDWLNRD
jgi:hypothetical protein